MTEIVEQPLLLLGLGISIKYLIFILEVQSCVIGRLINVSVSLRSAHRCHSIQPFFAAGSTLHARRSMFKFSRAFSGRPVKTIQIVNKTQNKQKYITHKQRKHLKTLLKNPHFPGGNAASNMGVGASLDMLRSAKNCALSQKLFHTCHHFCEAYIITHP